MSPHTECQNYANIPQSSSLRQTFTHRCNFQQVYWGKGRPAIYACRLLSDCTIIVFHISHFVFLYFCFMLCILYLSDIYMLAGGNQVAQSFYFIFRILYSDFCFTLCILYLSDIHAYRWLSDQTAQSCYFVLWSLTLAFYALHFMFERYICLQVDVRLHNHSISYFGVWLLHFTLCILYFGDICLQVVIFFFLVIRLHFSVQNCCAFFFSFSKHRQAWSQYLQDYSSLFKSV